MKKEGKKKKKSKFWQRLKALITKPQKELAIELDKKDLKAISQAVGQELVKVISELKLWLDKKLIKQLIIELKKELSKELPKVSKAKRFIEPKKVKIRESFINPIEEEGKLKHSFSKKPKGKKTSGAGLRESVKALKESQLKFRRK